MRNPHLGFLQGSTLPARHRSKRKVKKGLRAKLGRRRHEKVEIVDQVDGEASQQPPEASTEGDKGKKADIVEPSATEVEGQTSTAKPATPTGKPARGGFMPRGLSFRAPPVFRSGTDPVPQKFPGENAMPHHVRRLQSQPNINGQRHPSRSDTGRPKKLISRNDRVSTTPSEEGGPPPLSQTASIILLLASTGLVALCAEFLVGSIEHLVENSPLSEAFVGLIILPHRGKRRRACHGRHSSCQEQGGSRIRCLPGFLDSDCTVCHSHCCNPRVDPR
jgi:Ca2+:H+ antiporter